MALPFPMSMVGRGAAASSPLTYVGSTTQTANQSSYTFTGVDIGSANANRVVIVVVNGGNFSSTPTDVTFDGVSASMPISSAGSALVYLANPSGSTADIVVSFGDTVSNCTIEVYRGITTNATPADTDSQPIFSGTQSGAITGTLASGGFGIAYCIVNGTTDRSCTWTGATKNNEVFPEASTEGNLSVASWISAGAFSISAAWSGGDGSTRIALWGP